MANGRGGRRRRSHRPSLEELELGDLERRPGTPREGLLDGASSLGGNSTLGPLTPLRLGGGAQRVVGTNGFVGEECNEHRAQRGYDYRLDGHELPEERKPPTSALDLANMLAGGTVSEKTPKQPKYPRHSSSGRLNGPDVPPMQPAPPAPPHRFSAYFRPDLVSPGISDDEEDGEAYQVVTDSFDFSGARAEALKAPARPSEGAAPRKSALKSSSDGGAAPRKSALKTPSELRSSSPKGGSERRSRLGTQAEEEDDEAQEEGETIKAPTLEEEVLLWLAAVTGQQRGKQSLAAWLKDGQVLCHAANAIRPGVIPKVNDTNLPFKQMENISAFIAASQELGVPKVQTFTVPDLHDGKHLGNVLKCVHTLAGAARDEKSFGGPYLGKPRAKKTKRQFTSTFHNPAGTFQAPSGTFQGFPSGTS